jgi:hypothetical protein
MRYFPTPNPDQYILVGQSKVWRKGGKLYRGDRAVAVLIVKITYLLPC